MIAQRAMVSNLAAAASARQRRRNPKQLLFFKLHRCRVSSSDNTQEVVCNESKPLQTPVRVVCLMGDLMPHSAQDRLGGCMNKNSHKLTFECTLFKSLHLGPAATRDRNRKPLIRENTKSVLRTCSRSSSDSTQEVVCNESILLQNRRARQWGGSRNETRSKFQNRTWTSRKRTAHLTLPRQCVPHTGQHSSQTANECARAVRLAPRTSLKLNFKCVNSTWELLQFLSHV